MMSAESSMSTSPRRAGLDLRQHLPGHALDRVEQAFGLHLDRAGLVRKRRSIGAATNRGTWVRIEARPLEKLYGQGFNGTEAAAAVSGVAKPTWHASFAWYQPEDQLMWRADETDLVTATVIKRVGTLTKAPELSEQWWSTLSNSLNALAAAYTTRIATVDTVPITQARLTGSVTRVFGAGLGPTVTEWAPAHGDLSWGNLTAPDCWLLDWEDWGMAPRGMDAASLWVASLAVPTLAERVYLERRVDLDSRSGLLARLFFIAQLLAAPPDYAGPLNEPARHEANRLLTALD
jgi:hypothetical protein